MIIFTVLIAVWTLSHSAVTYWLQRFLMRLKWPRYTDFSSLVPHALHVTSDQRAADRQQVSCFLQEWWKRRWKCAPLIIMSVSHLLSPTSHVSDVSLTSTAPPKVTSITDKSESLSFDDRRRTQWFAKNKQQSWSNKMKCWFRVETSSGVSNA